MRRAALEQHVGEAAGRRADVQRPGARRRRRPARRGRWPASRRRARRTPAPRRPRPRRHPRPAGRASRRGARRRPGGPRRPITDAAARVRDSKSPRSASRVSRRTFPMAAVNGRGSCPRRAFPTPASGRSSAPARGRPAPPGTAALGAPDQRDTAFDRGAQREGRHAVGPRRPPPPARRPTRRAPGRPGRPRASARASPGRRAAGTPPTAAARSTAVRRPVPPWRNTNGSSRRSAMSTVRCAASVEERLTMATTCSENSGWLSSASGRPASTGANARSRRSGEHAGHQVARRPSTTLMSMSG